MRKVVVGAALALAVISAGMSARAQNGATAPSTPTLTVPEFTDALKNRRTDTRALAVRVQTWFGADNLKRGPNPKTNELTIVWAIETTPGQGAPRVVSDDGEFSLPLQRIGTTNVYAATASLPEGATVRWAYEVNGTRVGDFRTTEVYSTDPDLRPTPNVPKGTLTPMPPFKSKIYDGTTRNWWVYVPANYKPDGLPLAVMVYQDGAGPKNDVPTVLDNLIAKGDIPPMAAVFIDPGKFESNDRSNRSVEYDTLSDRYVRFLLEEILPETERAMNIKLRQDGAGRGISGVSSGGICAFTAAWEKPDQFSKVVSGVGSFVNLQGGSTGIGGGHNYPTLIRKSKNNPKPIRVFLSDGANDLDNPFGNWPLANKQMVRALDWAGYDYRFVFGMGFHGGRFSSALMPEALRYVWHDEAPPKR